MVCHIPVYHFHRCVSTNNRAGHREADALPAHTSLETDWVVGARPPSAKDACVDPPPSDYWSYRGVLFQEFKRICGLFPPHILHSIRGGGFGITWVLLH